MTNAPQMVTPARRRYALATSAGLALLAGCGGPQSPTVAPGTIVQAPATSTSSYKMLHSFFSSACDGLWPYASLIVENGTLYGTTWSGGRWNGGTIFSVTTDGTYQTLYNFPSKGQPGGRYGLEPRASLIDFNGRLHSTTQHGGADEYGTVFRFRQTSSERPSGARGRMRHFCAQAGTVQVIHSFASGSDGANPVSGLLPVGDTLYGTTPFGGSGSCSQGTYTGCGTIFAIPPKSRADRVLYSFKGPPYDGRTPYAALIDVNGTLYGTTLYGGAYNEGTVFSVSTSGSEQVLHSFGSGSDGQAPAAGLLDVNGTLYGTTLYGGANGDGTVFSISTSGSEHVRYSFAGEPDGRIPMSTLINLNGTLYGTTSDGGTYSCYSVQCGTIFSVSTKGKETVLYSFKGFHNRDGAYPDAGVVDLHGTLYGTTYAGGANGEGTVFAFTL